MPSTRQLKIGLSNADKTAMANQVATQTLDKVINGPITIDGEETSVKEKIEDINDALERESQKANADGYYPTMRVGQSDSIATEREIEDGEDACPPIVFGTAGGNAEIESGYQNFEELRGKTVKWKQIIKNGDFQSTSNWFMQNGSLSVSDGVVTFTQETINNNYTRLTQGLASGDKTIVGHKYYFRAYIKHNASKTIQINHNCGYDTNFFLVAPNVWTKIEVIFTATIIDDYFTISFFNGSGTYYVDEQINVDVKLVNQFDLGTDAEYDSILAFNRVYPKPYYAYNPGELISSKSNALNSIGQNAFDGEWEIGNLPSGTNVYNCRSKNFIEVIPGETYALSNGTDVAKFTTESNGWYLYEYDADKNLIKNTVKYDGIYTPNTVKTFTLTNQTKYVKFFLYSNNADFSTSGFPSTFTFRIYWDTTNVPYKAYEKQTVNLPNIELRSAGDLCDVAYSRGGGKRRVGVVDLGALDWNNNESFASGLFSATVPGMNNTTESSQRNKGIICSKYIPSSVTALDSNIPDKSMLRYNGSIYVRDSEFVGKTTDEVKSLVNNVILNYELATETDITNQENPGWTGLVKVDNYGTIGFESSQDIQCPQAYFIRYTVSLSEWVDTAYEHTGGDAKKIALAEDTKKTKIDFSSSLIVDGSTNLTEYRKELYFVKSKNSIKLFCYYSAKNETENAIAGVRIINTNLLISDEFIASKIKDSVGNPLSNSSASNVDCLIQTIYLDGLVSLKGIRLTHSSTNQLTFYDGGAVSVPASGNISISIEKEWFVE